MKDPPLHWPLWRTRFYKVSTELGPYNVLFLEGRDYNTVDGCKFRNTNAPSTVANSEILVHRWRGRRNNRHISSQNLCLMTTLTLIPTLRPSLRLPGPTVTTDDVYKEILYAIWSFNTTDNVLSRETCANLCLMNKLTLILTLKLKIVTTLNLTLNDFYDA